MIAGLIRQLTDIVAPGKRLRVLMYHSVTAGRTGDDLTITVRQLEEQFGYLLAEGYNTILLSDLVRYYKGEAPLPQKPVLITFDDGFRDNVDIAYPLARQYGIKVNFFLVPHFIATGSYRDLACAGRDELVALDPTTVEFGLHSFEHSSYADLVPSRVESDLARCRSAMTEMGIPFQPCLAYPYGAYPKRRGLDQDRLFEILGAQGIQLGFRIGNRLNPLPLRDPFLVQRLDIRGDESFLLFKLSVRMGKKTLGLPRLFDSINTRVDKIKSKYVPLGTERYTGKEKLSGSRDL